MLLNMSLRNLGIICLVFICLIALGNSPSSLPEAVAVISSSPPPVTVESVTVYKTEVIYHPSEIYFQDVVYLAALCVVETKGMEERSAESCMSVVSTVLTRIEKSILSDGTVEGTITWDCNTGDLECQFPAYVVNGCNGIVAHMCPYNYPQDLIEMFDLIHLYLLQRGHTIRAKCEGYLFYGLKEFDTPECRIESENGLFINFHNGLNNP